MRADLFLSVKQTQRMSNVTTKAATETARDGRLCNCDSPEVQPHPGGQGVRSCLGSPEDYGTGRVGVRLARQNTDVEMGNQCLLTVSPLCPGCPGSPSFPAGP